MPVLDDRRRRHQVVLPRHVVDVDLHDAHVRQRGAEMRAHQGGQVAVEVVRRHVDLVRLGHVADLHALGEAVPGDVDDGHVHRVVLEEGAELPPREQRFATRDGGAQRIADLAQRQRVVTVDLEPHQAQVVEGARHRQVALGLEVEIQVEEDVHVRPRAFAQRRQLFAQRADDAARRVQVDPVLEPRHVQRRRLAVEQEDVGLERAEPAFAHLAPEGDEIVRAGKGRDPHRLGAVQAVGPAMRPVEPHPVARRPAEQRIYGDSERLRLYVEQRVLDRRDGLLRHAAGRLARARVEARRDRLHRPGVGAHQPFRQPPDDRRQAAAAVAFVELRIADDSFVGAHLEEGEHPPSGVAMQVFDSGDFHAPLPSSAPSPGRPSYPPRRAAPTTTEGSADVRRTLSNAKPDCAKSAA